MGRPPPPLDGCSDALFLSQKLEHCLRLLVGLGKHRLRSLFDDVALGESRRRLRIVGVFDAAARFLRLC